jgi:hypothetical protein
LLHPPRHSVTGGRLLVILWLNSGLIKFDRMMTPIALVLALLAQSTPSSPVEAPQMSLAERAAAARKAAVEKSHATSKEADAPPALSREQRGEVRGSKYINDFLHFQIDLSNQWEPLNEERVARDEAIARRYINPDERSSPYRVLWIGDKAGRNVALSLVAAQGDLATSDLNEVMLKFKKASRIQLARVENLVEGTEPVLLGDPGHKFRGFRFNYTVQGRQIVQSGQVTKKNGLLMLFAVTGSSHEDVREALLSLNARMVWSEIRP